MDLTRKELYTLASKIAYGYLIRNYSKTFVSRCEKRIEVVFVDPKKLVVHLHCQYTGNEFKLNINLAKKKIEHQGCYAKNKGYDQAKLIDENIKIILKKR